MKALSFSPPWDWAVLTQGKDVENRVWRLPHYMQGKRILVHVAKRWDAGGYDYLEALHRTGKIEKPPLKSEHPCGVIAGEITLRGYCAFERLKPEHQNHWTFGPFCWGLFDPLAFKNPVPCKGALGFFSVPDEIVAQASAA